MCVWVGAHARVWLISMIGQCEVSIQLVVLSAAVSFLTKVLVESTGKSVASAELSNTIHMYLCSFLERHMYVP